MKGGVGHLLDDSVFDVDVAVEASIIVDDTPILNVKPRLSTLFNSGGDNVRAGRANNRF